MNEIGPDGAAALAGSPHLAGLQSLHLGRNRIGEAGAGALASSPYLGNLVFLAGFGNGLSADATKALRQRFGDAVRT